jgi:uncharacterized protein YndB with AHSA1/START domain
MSAAETRSVVIERQFPFPPEKIWRALTEGDLIRQWLMDNDFQPVVGHRFTFRMPPMPGWNGVIDSEITVVEEKRKLSYRWDSLGLESLVEWTLTATPGGTLVRMEQSGFRADQEAAYRGAGYGWQKFIGQMEGVVKNL